MRGSYPGGPRRRGGGEAGRSGRTPRLHSAEELEARGGHAASRRQARHRRRRAWVILGAALALAGGAGLYLGFVSHRTSEQLSTEREAERQNEISDQINDETNRILMELWRMEDVEFQRNRGGP
jgi:hypothetical protein